MYHNNLWKLFFDPEKVSCTCTMCMYTSANNYVRCTDDSRPKFFNVDFYCNISI